MEDKPEPYHDVSTVESQRNDRIAEEFPEGPYGSSLSAGIPDKPSGTGQGIANPYGYENRGLHGRKERGYPGDDRIRDETFDQGEP